MFACVAANLAFCDIFMLASLLSSGGLVASVSAHRAFCFVFMFACLLSSGCLVPCAFCFVLLFACLLSSGGLVAFMVANLGFCVVLVSLVCCLLAVKSPVLLPI